MAELLVIIAAANFVIAISRLPVKAATTTSLELLLAMLLRIF
jgi:hypothetical protein